MYFVPRFTRAEVPTPRRQLVDFERVHVVAGSTVSTPFVVNMTQLALVAANGSRLVYPGDYTILFTNGVNASATCEVSIQSGMLLSP